MPASTDPLKDLDAFVGEWNVAGAMTLDEPMEISGWTGFEWLAGGGFLVQRSTTELTQDDIDARFRAGVAGRVLPPQILTYALIRHPDALL
jgi:hypothetical protein